MSNKGVTLSYLGRYQEAIGYFDRALAINPDNNQAAHSKQSVITLMNDGGSLVKGDITVTTPQPSSEDLDLSSSDGGNVSNSLLSYLSKFNNNNPPVVNNNNPPVASDVSAATTRNQPIDIQLLASDKDNDDLTASVVTAPSHGTLSTINQENGMVTYTPNDGFAGSDTFTFKVNDGRVDSNTGTVRTVVNQDQQQNLQTTSKAFKTKSQLIELRKLIEKTPNNTITGSCEDFKKRLNGDGAKTPDGDTNKSGGITDYKIDVRWEKIPDKNITTKTSVIGKNVIVYAEYEIRPTFYIKTLQSYGLFWDNHGKCIEMYEKFLNDVAIHEGKHRADIISIINKYKEDFKTKTYTIKVQGKNIKEAVDKIYEELKYTPSEDPYIKSPFEKKMQTKIIDEIKKANVAYHNTNEGGKDFPWDCTCAIGSKT